MNQGLIPRRYAKALLEYAGERHEDSRVYELMRTLSGSFAANQDLQSAVANPFVSYDDKVKLLTTAAGTNADDKIFVDFLNLLRTNNRVDIIRDVALAYQRLYRKANNIYKVEVVSASPLGEDEQKRLKSLIESRLDGAKMEYTLTIDPSLIGGFVINIDSERLDASIKNELEQLRLTLIGK